MRPGARHKCQCSREDLFRNYCHIDCGMGAVEVFGTQSVVKTICRALKLHHDCLYTEKSFNIFFNPAMFQQAVD